MVELIITQTTTPANGQATVLQPGIYEISGTITATIGAEGNVTVQALGNGTFIPPIL